MFQKNCYNPLHFYFCTAPKPSSTRWDFAHGFGSTLCKIAIFRYTKIGANEKEQCLTYWNFTTITSFTNSCEICFLTLVLRSLEHLHKGCTISQKCCTIVAQRKKQTLIKILNMTQCYEKIFQHYLLQCFLWVILLFQRSIPSQCL